MRAMADEEPGPVHVRFPSSAPEPPSREGLVKHIVTKRRRRSATSHRRHLKHRTKMILFWTFAMLASATAAYTCTNRLTQNLVEPSGRNKR
jgi:hypothetical protein